LNSEGDDFFKRNFANREIPDLRLNKKVIYDEIKESGISYKRVLEPRVRLSTTTLAKNNDSLSALLYN
jgi:hypothetical protein